MTGGWERKSRACRNYMRVRANGPFLGTGTHPQQRFLLSENPLKPATYDIRQTSIKTSFAIVISTLLNNAPLSAHSLVAEDPHL